MASGDGPRLRMAPSPTGFLQLGNVRTFLFDYLYARGHDGALVLRIEDTDAERSTPEAEAYLVDALHWLGIQWDEGPDIGGAHGPYRQTERTGYREVAARLTETGHAYECFCTREELEQDRRQQQERGEAPRYSGRCYGLSEEQRARLRAEGREASIRFHVPTGRSISWNDRVYGHTSFEGDALGDFVILRPNGLPIYNFANVVDDHEQEITIVVRGQQHLSNTPLQILLYEALDWSIPEFAHLPDVLDQNRQRLAKRRGAKGVTEYREEGYLPEAVVNVLALLGWSPPGGEEFLSLDDLCRQFSFDRVQRSNAAFDPARLDWFNGQYIRRMPLTDLIVAAAPFLQRTGLVPTGALSEEERARLSRILPHVRERVRTLAEIPSMVEFLYRDPSGLGVDSFQVKDLKRRDLAQTSEALEAVQDAVDRLEEWTPEALLAAMDGVAVRLDWRRGELLMAVRIAITGKTVTPPLIESLEVLGRAVTMARLERARRALAVVGADV